jgi:hypothetical protein
MPSGQTGFKRCLYSAMKNISYTIDLYKQINKKNRAISVIDVFFSGRVGREKGLRESA